MALSFTVPAEYPWVILTAVGFLWLNAYQTFNVSKHRKSAKIEYPQLYAEQSEATKSFEAKKFNCAQRAHQNTLETLPTTLFTLLFCGLKYPILSASLGAAWIVGRVIYTIGYSTGNPENRQVIFAMPPATLLGLLATWIAVDIVRSLL